MLKFTDARAVLGCRVAPQELTNPEEYDRLKLRCWFWVSAIRRFDGALNALELAFLSGILWQGNPPEEQDGEMESRARLRGLTSMSAPGPL